MPSTRQGLVVPTLVLLAGILAASPSSPALPAEEPAKPAPGPGDGEPKADLEALKKEMEETFLRIQRDFEALTGERAAERLRSLEESVRRLLRTAGEDAARAADMAAAWVEEKLLGPVVAERMASRVERSLAAGAELAEALSGAVGSVFPEKSMVENWDKHFLDLPVVRRWAEARSAAPGSGAKEPVPPEPVREPAIPDPADMVLVPKGELTIPANRGRGWPNFDQKAERRTVRSFYIDRLEVSCDAYAAFLRNLRNRKLRERILPNDWEVDENGLPLVPGGKGALPVTGIPYEGAAAYADHLGKRLPTEDEWERAARGSEGLLYPWGDAWKDGSAVAGGKTDGPAPVGSTPTDRSPFGALDMAGNVSEMCATFVDGKPIKSLPRETDQVVRRGGNYREPVADAASDWRYVVGPTARSELVGFRCAMDERDYERKYGKK